MTTPAFDDPLRNLLLRRLPPEEATRLEEAILTEEGFAERLRDAEFDLIDDYARGRLTTQEQAAMERYVLTTPEHAQSVRVARAMAAQGSAQRQGGSPRFLEPAAAEPPRRRNKLLPVAALLAAGLAALAVVPRYWSIDQGHSAMLPSSGAGPAPAVVAGDVPAAKRTPEQTILLLADTRRGDSATVVRLASDAVTVRLQTEVPRAAQEVLYSLRMDDAAGAPIVGISHLRPRTAGPYTFVEADIPAEAFGPGARNILLTVDGAAQASTPEYRWRIDIVRVDPSREN